MSEPKFKVGDRVVTNELCQEELVTEPERRLGKELIRALMQSSAEHEGLDHIPSMEDRGGVITEVVTAERPTNGTYYYRTETCSTGTWEKYLQLDLR